MRLDLTNVVDNGPIGPVPPGRYSVVCTGGTEEVVKQGSRNEGAPLFKWEFTVSDPASDYDNRKIWDNMVIVAPTLDEKGKEKGGTYWRVKQLLTAAGIDTSEAVEFDIDDIVDAEMILEVEIREGRTDPETQKEYKDTNRVKRFISNKADDTKGTKPKANSTSGAKLR